MTSSLARRLKAARLRLGFTVREVQRLSGRNIGNGYLSQLENGKDYNPSPRKLRVLCRVLKLDYFSILMSAGYVTKKDIVVKRKYSTECKACGHQRGLS